MMTWFKEHKWLCLLFLLLPLLCAGYWFLSMRLDRPLISIQQIKVEGPFRSVTQAQVQAVVSPFMSDDFIRFPAHRLQHTIMAALPWVESVRVVREWPPALRLVLTERTAVAFWNEDALIDSDGVVFRPLKPWPEGLLQFNGPADHARLLWAHLKTVQELCPAIAGQLTTLSLNDRGAWTMGLRSGLVAQLGRNAFDQRVSILCQIKSHSSLVKMGKGPQLVDLRYPNGFTVGPLKTS